MATGFESLYYSSNVFFPSSLISVLGSSNKNLLLFTLILLAFHLANHSYHLTEVTQLLILDD